MCRMLGAAPSGYFDPLNRPLSNYAVQDSCILRPIYASLSASYAICGAPRSFLVPWEAGESGANTVPPARCANATCAR